MTASGRFRKVVRTGAYDPKRTLTNSNIIHDYQTVIGQKQLVELHLRQDTKHTYLGVAQVIIMYLDNEYGLR